MMNEKYILLVEDNEDDVVLTQKAFKKCGIANKLEVVYDGQEALDFLFKQGKYANRNRTGTPAVVLLDLKLPYVGGLEVLRKIRMDSKICRLPVVVLSSSVNTQEIEDCYKLGINRYCRKPGNFEQFKRIIEEIRYSFLDRDSVQARNEKETGRV